MRRQVDVAQGDQRASAAGEGVSGTDAGPLSDDVTGGQRAPRSSVKWGVASLVVHAKQTTYQNDSNERGKCSHDIWVSYFVIREPNQA
jgi:hypothetical protein